MRATHPSDGVCLSLFSFRDTPCSLTPTETLWTKHDSSGKKYGGTTEAAHHTNPYLAPLLTLPISQHVALKYHASVANSARRYPSEIYNSCVKHFVCPVLKINNPNLFLTISLTPETACFRGSACLCVWVGACMHARAHSCVCVYMCAFNHYHSSIHV